MKFWGWVAFAIGITGFTLDFLRLKNKSFNQIAVKVLGPILRKSELESFSGLPFYAMGIALSIYFYSTDIALLSIFFLVFADPAASFIGVSYGKDQILPNKSLQGTFAGFVVCYFTIVIYTADYPVAGLSLFAFALFGAVVGAISELFSAFNIDDNITIPVVSGAGLTLLNEFFQIF
ncbi:MAG: hypothetical protein WEB87_03155 [Bacteriovoracaceae bacterium]